MISDELRAAVRSALVELDVEPDDAAVTIERPNDPSHGDWSTNAALSHAKAAGRNPRELATALAGRIESAGVAHLAAVEVAGPGFVNFRLADSWLHDVLTEAVGATEKGFGRNRSGEGRKVLVEFVSANPTGPLHAGHARGAVYGDSLARLLEANGYSVGREYYLNDRGTQMAEFGRSLEARRDGREPGPGGYHGRYVAEWADEMPAGVDPVEWGRARAVESHRHDLGRLGITFESWFSEAEMVGSGAIASTMERLREAGAVYESEGATWLRTTEAGDDKDRVLVKSDGELTYLAPDVAYHLDKYDRGYDLLIDVLGADHHGYTARMKAAMVALGREPESLEMIITQLVTLVRDGQEVRLSKRTGEMITLAELVDELGPDVTRFTYLLQSVDSRQTLDLNAAVEQSMENPVFYVQYAHARIHSIMAKADEAGIRRAPLDSVDLTLLAHPRELDLLRRLSELGDVVESACADRAPHRLVTWVRELASAFHGFYRDCYVIGDVPPELTQARLWLVEATRVGLVSALEVIGVSAPESM